MERQQNTLAKRLGGKVSPPAELVNALTQVSPAAAEFEVVRLFRHGFAWFSEGNRQEALQHVQAAVIAGDHNLMQQLVLHVKEAQMIASRDLADRVQAAVMESLGYRGPRHFYPNPLSDPFIVCDYVGSTTYEWHYTRIEQFERLIPSQALAALAFLKQAGIDPQAYWVADKFRRASVHRASLQRIDPILSAQFGPFFVAISEWV